MTDVQRGGADQGFLALQRQLLSLARDPSAFTDGQAILETGPMTEAPRLVRADVIEGNIIRPRRVLGDPVASFAAFLDGTQTSRIVAYAAGVPIILGTVAAVIRARRNRRLTTWYRPTVARRLYAPLAALPPAWRSVLDGLGLEVVDTTAADDVGSSPTPTPHPFTLRDEAVHRVQQDRERAEQRLAERWCAHETDPLLVDGGISGSERVAVASCTVGVVKSHRTLYAEGDALQAIFSLRPRERSSVFRVTSPKRTTVASWYLRMRDPSGKDPMWGLVRVEIALPNRVDEAEIGGRADEVSRWILAEASPLAMPDPRWDKMVYGIRDCEEFLRAVT